MYLPGTGPYKDEFDNSFQKSYQNNKANVSRVLVMRRALHMHDLI